jgi:hypothetical protein
MIRSTSKIRKTKGFPRPNRGKPFESKQSVDYGLGLDVVVVLVELEVDELGVVAVVVVFVFVVSLVFSFSVVGFTTVVLLSTFLSGAGEVVVGATTVLSSQPPRSAAPAKMQSSFFIGFWIDCPSWDKAESNGAKFSALPKYKFCRQLRD